LVSVELETPTPTPRLSTLTPRFDRPWLRRSTTHQVKRQAHALLAHNVQHLFHREPELAARARQVGWAEKVVADAEELKQE
jgi:hypothetical protein